jgi:hypothetical protein
MHFAPCSQYKETHLRAKGSALIITQAIILKHLSRVEQYNPSGCFQTAAMNAGPKVNCECLID